MSHDDDREMLEPPTLTGAPAQTVPRVPADSTVVDPRLVAQLKATRKTASTAPADPRSKIPAVVTGANLSADIQRTDSGFLSRIPEDDRALLMSLGTQTTAVFGEVIITEGDPSDAAYVVLEGRVRVVKTGGQSNEEVLATLGPGEIFGEDALQGTPRTATVRSSSKTKLLKLDLETLNRVLAERPHIGGWLASYAERRRLATVFSHSRRLKVLPQRVLSNLIHGTVATELAPGQVAFREGDAPGGIYIVRSGRVNVSVADKVIAYLAEGDIFGVRSCYERTPRRATVEALNEVSLLALAPVSFANLIEKAPEFRRVVKEHIAAIDESREAPMPLDVAELERAAETVAQLPIVPVPPRGATKPVAEDKPRPTFELDPSPDEPFRSSDGYFVKGPKRQRKFTFVQQVDEMDCGVACLAMVCRAFGKRVSPGRLRSMMHTSVDGTSLGDIVSAAIELGLAARTARVSRDNLDKMPMPAIVHWQDYHWVVLVEVRKNKVRVADPAIGDRWMTRDKFLEGWNGYAALFDFTDAFDMTPDDRPTLAWIWPYFSRYSGAFSTSLLLAFVVAALTMVLPVLTQVVVDRVIVDGATKLLEVVLVTMGITFAFLVGSRLLQGYLLAFAAVRVDAALLDHLTRRLLALPLKYFTGRRTGDIQQRLDGAREIRSMIVSNGISGMLALVQLSVAILLMLVYSPKLTLVFAAMTPLYGGLMFLTARVLKPLFGQLEEEYGRYRSDQLDAIKGIEAVKGASAESAFRDQLLERFLQTTNKQFKVDYWVLVYEGSLQAVGYLSQVLFLWVGATLAIDGEITMGGFVAFNALVAMANGPIFTCLAVWDRYQHGDVLLNRLADVFEFEPEQGWDRSALIPVKTLSGAVELRDVHFRYGGPDSPAVLRRVDLVVAPGETIALVGRSGSGKTTLAKLIAGLYEPTDGTILFDGIDLRTLNHRDVRRRIGFVPQDNHMFSGSILENIAFGEEPDLERAIAAARTADAHGFVSQLPLGYATQIGESGMRLSGGQAQRIAIARALYKKPQVFIFDEATSALDTESERAIQENLEQFFIGRSAFVIAHRLSTVRNADRIVVLEKGEIVEQGDHGALMARRGIYYELVSKQVEQ